MRAARGHVKILLMPHCIPIGSGWLAAMVAPFEDEDVGVVVSQCYLQQGAEPGLPARLLDAVDPRERRTRKGGPRHQDMVSHLCDAYRASLLADIGYFDETHFATPGEAVDVSLKIINAGCKVLLSGAAVADYRVPIAERSLGSAMAKALDYGYSDAVLDRLHSLRWLNTGVFAAALASLLLLLLGAINLRLAFFVSLVVPFAWGWFLALRVPKLGWEIPPCALNFAAYVLVIMLIRGDWWPDLFGMETHPSIIRRWCWLGSLAGSYLLVLGWAGSASVLRSCRHPRGVRGILLAPAIFVLAMVWWLIAGAGYIRGQILATTSGD
jgi:hypothetical protein